MLVKNQKILLMMNGAFLSLVPLIYNAKNVTKISLNFNLNAYY